jgi:hypothetical protein
VAALALGSLAAAAEPASLPMPVPFAQVTPLPALRGTAALHDDRLAWAGRGAQSIDIYLTNLTTGRVETLSSILVVQAGTTVSSLGYDGRWVVWSDNRFGDFKLFGLDTRTGQSGRLTTQPQDDGQVVVAQGQLAWVHTGEIHLLDLASQKETALPPLAGRSYEPSMGGGYLAWTQAQGAERNVVVHALAGGIPDRTFKGGATLSYSPQVTGGRVVWEQRSFSKPRPGHVSIPTGSVIKALDLATGTVSNLTAFGKVSAPAGSAGRIAWLDQPANGTSILRVLDVATNATSSFAGPRAGGQLSAAFLVVPDSADGDPFLYAASWSALRASQTSNALLWLGAAALAVAGVAGYSAWRRRHPFT